MLTRYHPQPGDSVRCCVIGCVIDTCFAGGLEKGNTCVAQTLFMEALPSLNLVIPRGLLFSSRRKHKQCRFIWKLNRVKHRPPRPQWARGHAVIEVE